MKNVPAREFFARCIVCGVEGRECVYVYVWCDEGEGADGRFIELTGLINNSLMKDFSRGKGKL